MTASEGSSAQGRTEASLVALSFVHYGLRYALSLLVAHHLGADDYDSFAVPVASVVLLSTVVELGLGKLGIRQIPAFCGQRDFDGAAGYLRFALGSVLLASVVVGLLTAGIESVSQGGSSLGAPAEAALFLPFAALVGVGAELVTALGRPLRSALVTRIVVPFVPVAFALIAMALASGWEVSSKTLLIGYGLGWVTGLLALMSMRRSVVPKEIHRASPRYELGRWLRGGLGMVVVAAAITLLLEGSLILVELLPIDASDVSIFAICVDTGGFVFILSKSLDKAFLQRVSTYIERRDHAALTRQWRRRHLLIGGVCLVFTLLLAVFGGALLAWIGPGFERGHAALVLTAIGTSAMTLGSVSQWLVAYEEGPWGVSAVNAVTVVVLAGTIAWAEPRFGIEGVAASYALALGGAAMFSVARAKSLRTRLARTS